MGSYPDEFPFGIMEVVNLLNLRIRRQQANSVYVDCPFCGDRRGCVKKPCLASDERSRARFFVVKSVNGFFRIY